MFGTEQGGHEGSRGVTSTRGIRGRMYTRSMHRQSRMYTRGFDFVAGAAFWDISSRVVCTRAHAMRGRRSLEVNLGWKMIFLFIWCEFNPHVTAQCGSMEAKALSFVLHTAGSEHHQ